MRLTPEQVEHVALLARLRLTEDEKARFTTQLNSILEHFEQLQQIDTTDVEPMSHAVPMSNVLREDEVKPSLAPEEALRNAPDSDDDCFRVPRVIE
ncbi:MAG: Asp-tRNA(Asn)/Glu-tRNA(Gln) amidotransferase subunit GatC [Candidatus Eisenbacteria bacterium]|nr:Asp-tRNA(Asn)/Glu-tRNA(Gln) amidotransferase subunit GatC [Candidatus Eisenbacteria bacterium]